MKVIAYILILGSLLGFVVTDTVIEKSIEGVNIDQEMFETPKGRAVILSYLKSRDAALDLAIVTSTVFILLLGSGIALLLLERIKKMEKRLDKIERR